MTEEALPRVAIEKLETLHRYAVEIAGTRYQTTTTIAQPDSPTPRISLSVNALDTAEAASPTTIQLELPIADLQAGHLPAWQDFLAQALGEILSTPGPPRSAPVPPTGSPDRRAATDDATVDPGTDDEPEEDDQGARVGAGLATDEGEPTPSQESSTLRPAAGVSTEQAAEVRRAVREMVQSVVERPDLAGTERLIADELKSVAGELDAGPGTDDGQQPRDEELGRDQSFQ